MRFTGNWNCELLVIVWCEVKFVGHGHVMPFELPATAGDRPSHG